MLQANGLQKQAKEAIVLFDRVDFKPQLFRRNKDGYFILLTGKSNIQDGDWIRAADHMSS
jgi:hypothetical protein